MADSDWVDDDHGDWVDDKPHEDKFSAGQAAVMHGIQGLTGGFSDELQGLGEAAGRIAGVKGAGGPMRDMGLSPEGPTLDWETLRDAYREARDRERSSLKTQSKESPWVSGAADVAGMVASPINKLAGGMSLAGSGATLGGINALGASDKEDIGGMALDTAIGAGLGAGIGKGIDVASPYLSKAANAVASGIGNAGRSMYKSGLKRIDQEVAKYGKEPVSDLLMKHGITGDAQQIFEKMSGLGDDLLSQRNDILRRATRRGAEVDVPASLKEAQAYVDNLKNVDNPEARQAVKMLQSRIDEYMGTAAQEPQQFLRELPYTAKEKVLAPQDALSGYAASGEKASGEIGGYLTDPKGASGKYYFGSKGTDGRALEQFPDADIIDELTPSVQTSLKGWANGQGDQVVNLPQQMVEKEILTPKIATVLDEGVLQKGPMGVDEILDRVAGPSPLQTSAWKTTAANKVGDAGWEQLARSAEGKGFDKALSSGLRRGTEESVEKTLGPVSAWDLAQKNSDLGKILTSKERALLDAQMEGRRNAFTSVDGMLSTNPLILAMKKLADVSKTTQARTVGGKGLVDLSENIKQKLLQSPQMAELAQRSPQVFTAIAQKMEGAVGGLGKAAENESKPYDQEALMQKTQGTKYSQVLQDAAKRGPQAVGATHFILQQKDPQYRQLTIEGDDKGE